MIHRSANPDVRAAICRNTLGHAPLHYPRFGHLLTSRRRHDTATAPHGGGGRVVDGCLRENGSDLQMRLHEPELLVCFARDTREDVGGDVVACIGSLLDAGARSIRAVGQ